METASKRTVITTDKGGQQVALFRGTLLMSTLQIRAATSADLDAITAIYADAVLNGTATYELNVPDRNEMERRFTSLIEAGFPYLVAEDEAGRILGYAYAGPFRERPAYRFIVEDSVYLSPDAQGRELGVTLINRLIEEATALGFRQMIAVIGDGSPNSASVRVHQKLGFRHCGVMEGSGYKHGRWLDTTFMQLSMNGGNQTDPDPTSLPEKRFQASQKTA